MQQNVEELHDQNSTLSERLEFHTRDTFDARKRGTVSFQMLVTFLHEMFTYVLHFSCGERDFFIVPKNKRIGRHLI